MDDCVPDSDTDVIFVGPNLCGETGVWDGVFHKMSIDEIVADYADLYGIEESNISVVLDGDKYNVSLRGESEYVSEEERETVANIRDIVTFTPNDRDFPVWREFDFKNLLWIYLPLIDASQTEEQNTG